MDHLDSEQLHEIKVAFQMYDQPGNGYVHVDDLSTILRILGFNPTKNQIQSVHEKAIASGRGNKIDFPIFLDLITHNFTLGQDLSRQLYEAFGIFDPENTGHIEASELRHLITTMGDILPHDEVNQVLSETGTPNQGRIPYGPLIQAITTGTLSNHRK